MGLARTLVVSGLLTLLAGCSALQIDVDVYKGPLANQQAIQLRQFALLPNSAKPVVQQLLDLAMKRAGVAPDGTPRSCTNAGGAVALMMICDVLDQYQDQNQALLAAAYRFRTMEFKPAPGASAEDKRTKQELADQKRGALRAQLKSLGLHGLTNAFFEKLALEPDEAVGSDEFAELNTRFIQLAERMLYVANSQVLHRELADGGGDMHKTQIAILQSLGNIILVHANDLHRQHLRAEAQERRKEMELDAQRLAFELSPNQLYDRILKEAERQPIAAAAGDAGSAATKLLESKLTAQTKKRDDAAQARRDHDVSHAPVLAAYRSLLEESSSLFPSVAVAGADLKLAKADREALAKRLAALTITEGAKPADALHTEIGVWLNEELAKSDLVVVRQERLAAFKRWHEAAKAPMATALAESKKIDDGIKALQAWLKQEADGPARKHRELQRVVVAEQAAMSQLDRQVKEAQKADVLREAQQRLLPFLAEQRKHVLDKVGPQAKAQDVQGKLQARLKELAASPAGKDASKPEAHVIDAALQLLRRMPDVHVSSCSSRTGERGPQSQIEVADCLIADLRAQRVEALAGGRRSVADSLLEAINAAYDQRTTMLYLRPAADYLRSVYSSSEFQEGTDPTKRNMLKGWMDFMNPRDVGGQYGREQLEKLHWQNVNRVSLGGGGQTNYVLAKDDVGNWYVKAYSADPESVFKSATSLALFNAGKAINTNLLRRHELQSRIDNPATGDEDRKRMTGELDKSNSSEGYALLKVRDRYASQYAVDTEMQATKLASRLAAVRADASKAITDTTLPSGSECAADKVAELLTPLDADLFNAARKDLGDALAWPKEQAGERLGKLETALRGGITKLIQFGDQARRVVANNKVDKCSAVANWSVTAADSAAAVARQTAIDMATERRVSIARFDDALSNLLEVATAH